MQEKLTQAGLGDFGVVSIEGTVGWLIRIGQWLNGSGFRNYEHAFVYIGAGKIVEAEPGGAKISDLSEYDGRSILWSTGKVLLTDEQRTAVVEAAKGFVGVPYSFLDYFLLALKRLHISVPILNKRVLESKHLICSQLVAESYAAARVVLTSKPAYAVTPADLANLIT
jgi:uncharacterized protein YycO